MNYGDNWHGGKYEEDDRNGCTMVIIIISLITAVILSTCN